MVEPVETNTGIYSVQIVVSSPAMFALFSNPTPTKKRICIMEVLTIIFNGSPVRFKFFHILANFFGFSLTPLLFLTLRKALLPNPQKHKTINPLIFVWFLYFLIQNIFLSTQYLQNSNKILFLNFILSGTTIQVLFPKIQITWTTVIISMFVYFDTLYQRTNSQTY